MLLTKVIKFQYLIGHKIMKFKYILKVRECSKKSLPIFNKGFFSETRYFPDELGFINLRSGQSHARSISIK